MVSRVFTGGGLVWKLNHGGTNYQPPPPPQIPWFFFNAIALHAAVVTCRVLSYYWTAAIIVYCKLISLITCKLQINNFQTCTKCGVFVTVQNITINYRDTNILMVFNDANLAFLAGSPACKDL